MRVSDFRRLALGLPGAEEGSHFGNADFRVGGKIFATLSLAKQGYGVLLLTPEQQQGMVEDEPEIFSAIPNGWGRHGATRVALANKTHRQIWQYGRIVSAVADRLAPRPDCQPMAPARLADPDHTQIHAW